MPSGIWETEGARSRHSSTCRSNPNQISFSSSYFSLILIVVLFGEGKAPIATQDSEKRIIFLKLYSNPLKKVEKDETSRISSFSFLTDTLCGLFFQFTFHFPLIFYPILLPVSIATRRFSNVVKENPFFLFCIFYKFLGKVEKRRKIIIFSL